MLRGVIFMIVVCQGFLGMSQEVVLEEEDEIDIVNQNGELYMEYTQVIEDLTAQYEMITEHAQGVDLFMTSLLKSVEEGQDTVKIPEQIDPDESSIGIEDAIDKIDDMCDIDMTITQQFLLKIEKLIDQMKNGTETYRNLIEMKKDIEAVAEVYINVKRKVLEQRQSLTINQLYEYLYIDDQRDPSIKSAGQDDDTAASIQQNFNIIPYGNDAHHENDEDNDNLYEFPKESSAQDQGPRPELLTKKTPIEHHIKISDDFPHVPTFAIIFTVLSIAVFTLIAIVLCVCVTQKRKQAKSPTPSLAEETKKEPISIVTIPVDCHKPIQHTNTEPNDLPCYLDVICDKM